MALIITDKGEAVAKRVLIELRRGMTALSGKGMYSGKEHSVLICAITVTEVNSLKAAVVMEDPNAFVVVSPAQEILDADFRPLQLGKNKQSYDQKAVLFMLSQCFLCCFDHFLIIRLKTVTFHIVNVRQRAFAVDDKDRAFAGSAAL